mmetsp:Transcript_1563/g.3388  ORF Transcript_1563/g.3388 Transcript_1563/m.3388 type:complete len:242 (-) Transcript_1563:1167-1892(-)
MMRFDSSICLRSSAPTMPEQPMTATESCMLESASAAWAARSALVQSSCSTMIEICRSEEPCAMERMLIPALAIAFVKVAPVPGRKAIPSPTIATTACPCSMVMPATKPLASSFSKATSRTVRAVSASGSPTARQMEESAEACVSMTTCTPARSRVPKRREAMSGTDEVPVPSMLTRATLSTEVMPRMGDSPSPSLTGQAALRTCFFAADASSSQACCEASSVHARPWMTVPGCEGLKTFRT